MSKIWTAKHLPVKLKSKYSTLRSCPSCYMRDMDHQHQHRKQAQHFCQRLLPSNTWHQPHRQSTARDDLRASWQRPTDHYHTATPIGLAGTHIAAKRGRASETVCPIRAEPTARSGKERRTSVELHKRSRQIYLRRHKSAEVDSG